MFLMNQNPCSFRRPKPSRLCRRLGAPSTGRFGHDRRLRSSGSGAEGRCGRFALGTVNILGRTELSASVLTAPLGFAVVGQLEVAGTTQGDLLSRPEEGFLFPLQSQHGLVC